MTATAPPIGTRVRPTTNPDRPGVVTAHGAGWVTVRHDNGETVDWFLWAIEVIA